MRVTIERANLLKSLNHVHRVVERRNTIPILSNVLLKADGGSSSLEMKATDLDLEITEADPGCRRTGRCDDGRRPSPLRHRAQAARGHGSDAVDRRRRQF